MKNQPNSREWGTEIPRNPTLIKESSTQKVYQIVSFLTKKRGHTVWIKDEFLCKVEVFIEIFYCKVYFEKL